MFEKVVKQAKSYAIKLPVDFPFLISGILINKKHDIVSAKDEIGVSLSLLNFTYKLFFKKLVPNIVLPNISNIDKSDMVFVDNMIDVPPKYRMVRSHTLDVLM